MKDPEYTGWAEEVGRESTVFTGVYSTCSDNNTCTKYSNTDVFAFTTMLDGGDCFRADKSDYGRLCCRPTCKAEVEVWIEFSIGRVW